MRVSEKNVSVTIPDELKFDLQVSKIMTGRKYGETLWEAYLFAKAHGFNPESPLS